MLIFALLMMVEKNLSVGKVFKAFVDIKSTSDK